MLKDMLWHQKVLLVIDDVNDKEQLENLAGGHDWFGEGSRFFITSRNKSLLARHKVDELYELPQLNWDQALELFSWHAFDRRLKDFWKREIEELLLLILIDMVSIYTDCMSTKIGN